MIPCTVTLQAPLSMGFSRPKCWSGLPFPSPGALPDPGIKPGSLALQANSLPSETPGKATGSWGAYQRNDFSEPWSLHLPMGGLAGGTSGKEPACLCRRLRDAGSTPGSRRSPRGGHGYPLQYSRLENVMDRGAWWVTIHSVIKSQTRLKWLSTHARYLFFFN